MVNLSIKPLSVNKCWQGRRFKTKDYKEYEIVLLSKLPNIEIPEGNLSLSIVFGFEKKIINRVDIDNPIKPFLDILQKKYGFNDNKIQKIKVKKVSSLQNYIQFEIKEKKR